MLGTEIGLGVRPPEECLYVLIASPTGSFLRAAWFDPADHRAATAVGDDRKTVADAPVEDIDDLLPPLGV
jgi:hypothetical protein